MDDVEQLIKSALGEDAERFEYTVAGRSRVGWRKYEPKTRTFREAENRSEQLVDSWWRAFHGADVRLFVGSGVFRLASGEYVDGIDADEWPNPNVPDYPPLFDQIFALPGLPTLDVIEFAKTGSHNNTCDCPEARFEQTFAFLRARAAELGPDSLARLEREKEELRQAMLKQPCGPEPWRYVREELAKIMGECPFAILAANEGWLRARFLAPVSAKHAEQFLNQILELGWDSINAMGHKIWFRERGPLTSLADLKDWLPKDEDEFEAARRCILGGEFYLWWD